MSHSTDGIHYNKLINDFFTIIIIIVKSLVKILIGDILLHLCNPVYFPKMIPNGKII